MAFNPGLNIGQILKNSEVVDTFKCGNMGGMCRSKTTNTLVIVPRMQRLQHAGVTALMFIFLK